MMAFGLDYYTACGVGFFVGWIASALITKGIRAAQSQPGKQQHQTQYQPYDQGQQHYQQQPGSYQYQPSQQYSDKRYSTTTGKGYGVRTHVKSGSMFKAHVCKKCGGPVNLNSRTCDYCGARN
jgi:hypothetical protein